MRVEAEYRIERDGTFGAWRRVVLPVQPGGAFERLVEADGDRVEVVFRTEDMETAPTVVRLVPPPAVRSASLVVEPPSYVRGTVDRRTADLGTGMDRRATVSPIGGSTRTRPFGICEVARSARFRLTQPTTRQETRDVFLNISCKRIRAISSSATAPALTEKSYPSVKSPRGFTSPMAKSGSSSERSSNSRSLSLTRS
jgi:hypothetical protein